MNETLKKMSIKPGGMEETITKAYSMPPQEAWNATENLMRETVGLVELHIPELDTSRVRVQLDRKRKRQSEMPEAYRN